MVSSAKLFQSVGIASAVMTLAIMPHTAQAQTVVAFNGRVISSCIMTVTTTGVVAMNTAGTEIGSEQSGGSAAVLNVVTAGGKPTLLFSAPTMSVRPVAYAGTPTVSLRYVSPGGANQTYTTGLSQYRSTNPFGDTITLNARAVDSTGIEAGDYRLETTATCQQ